MRARSFAAPIRRRPACSPSGRRAHRARSPAPWPARASASTVRRRVERIDFETGAAAEAAVGIAAQEAAGRPGPGVATRSDQRDRLPRRRLRVRVGFCRDGVGEAWRHARQRCQRLRGFAAILQRRRDRRRFVRQAAIRLHLALQPAQAARHLGRHSCARAGTVESETKATTHARTTHTSRAPAGHPPEFSPTTVSFLAASLLTPRRIAQRKRRTEPRYRPKGPECAKKKSGDHSEKVDAPRP